MSCARSGGGTNDRVPSCVFVFSNSYGPYWERLSHGIFSPLPPPPLLSPPTRCTLNIRTYTVKRIPIPALPHAGTQTRPHSGARTVRRGKDGSANRLIHDDSRRGKAAVFQHRFLFTLVCASFLNAVSDLLLYSVFRFLRACVETGPSVIFTYPSLAPSLVARLLGSPPPPSLLLAPCHNDLSFFLVCVCLALFV